MIKGLKDIFGRSSSLKKKTMVVAAAHDENVLDAVSIALEKNIIDAILVGDKEKIIEIAETNNYNISSCEIIDEKDTTAAAVLAVKIVHDGAAQIIMKGKIETAPFLRPILARDTGLRIGELLSSLSIFELNGYHKIIGLTDGGLNIAPDLNEKVGIINNAVNFFRGMGIEKPKIAVLGPVERVRSNMKSTMDGAMLSKMAQRGQIANCIIDGPLSFDNAISKESAEYKNIDSEVAGDADVLIAHNIEVANVLYKSFVYLAKARPASVTIGASVPVVLTSRADTDIIKLNSIILAASVEL